MKIKISEFEIKPGFNIRKGSVVALNDMRNGRPIGVEVFDIFKENGEIKIESKPRTYGSPMTHHAWQYAEFGELIKY